MYHLPPCMNVKCNKMHIHILLSQCRFPMFSVFVIVSYIPAIPKDLHPMEAEAMGDQNWATHGPQDGSSLYSSFMYVTYVQY